jgi:hypothetical protein
MAGYGISLKFSFVINMLRTGSARRDEKAVASLEAQEAEASDAKIIPAG